MTDKNPDLPGSGPEHIVNEAGVGLFKQLAKNTIQQIKVKVKNTLNGKSNKQN